ncbi:MAG: c-type cytochrome [Acetobacteraceae bacterium]
MASARTWFRRILTTIIALAVLGIVVVSVGWWKFLHAEHQVFDTPRDRFQYGSLGSELVAGIPYPIFMILPRVFPDLVEKYAMQGYGPKKPGWGGYDAFGLAWEQGQRLPAGFSIRRVGYDRLTINCALCHTATYRMSPDADRVIVTGGPAHMMALRNLLDFLFAASHDARFTAARLMPEIALNVPLDWLDWQIYSFYLIPKTRLALQLAESELKWTQTKPAWGPGRDDPFNLPKYNLLREPLDDTVGNTDFPALWQMSQREGRLLHSSGEAKTVYAVTATSAFGIGSLPGHDFRDRNQWIVDYLTNLPAPKFPGPVDAARAARGQAIFDAQCGSCHGANGARTGTSIPLEDVGTDPGRARSWTDDNAARMNRLTGALGMTGADLQGARGYIARPLTGLWLLGPYLHNGSVPTLADMLSPPDRRPKTFYRGYDILDLNSVGFVSTGTDAEAYGYRYDTTQTGNGNGGHSYGTALSPDDRRDLLEYLKTL